MNIIITLIMIASGLAGCWYHWLEVRRRGEQGTFFQYFFISETPSSTATVVAWIAAMESVFIVGGFAGLDFNAAMAAFKAGVFYPPIITAMGLSFSAGYMADSKLNKMGGLPPAKDQPLPPSV